MFRKILDEIINFVLPNSCISCDEPIGPKEKFVCRNCFQMLEKYEDIHPWNDEYAGNGIITDSLSAFWFREGTVIQTLMHALKYQKMRSIGKLLGNELGIRIKELNAPVFDYIIPVPLHKAKLRDRTYNQSEFIAMGIQIVIPAEVIVDGVIRTRFTGTQTRLNKAERKINVTDAFTINPKHSKRLAGKNIIVVDDVITTGATILECAGALKKSGARNILVSSAAYAELKAEEIPD